MEKDVQICCCSVAKLCLTLCDPLDYSMPGFPVLHCLPEFVQSHVHWVSNAIQPSHPLLPLSLPASNLSQPQGFSNELALCISWLKYWSFSISTSNEYSGIWFPLGLIGLISLQSKGLSRVFSNTTVWKHQFFCSQPSLWSNTHTCTLLLEKP